MKWVLFLLLLTPLFSFSQRTQLIDHIVGINAGRNASYILLPGLRRTDFYKIYEISQNSYDNNYVVSHDSTYYKLFSQYPKDSLPVFDFTCRELVAYFACVYCRRSFNTTGNLFLDNAPRHRNACMYTHYWFARDKMKPAD